MAKITLTMDDGREVGFSGFPDSMMESLFKALQYYQVINNRKPMVNVVCCDPEKGPINIRVVDESCPTNTVVHKAVAQLTFVVPSKT